MENGDPHKNKGRVRTDLSCHQCGHTFIAQLDYGVDGNHIIECPYCGHEHCRFITGGKITEDRWSSRGQRVDVEARNVWKSDVLPAQTSAASHFIRERWLNFGNDHDNDTN